MMYGGWGRENYGTTPTKVDALEVRGSPEECHCIIRPLAASGAKGVPFPSKKAQHPQPQSCVPQIDSTGALEWRNTQMKL